MQDPAPVGLEVSLGEDAASFGRVQIELSAYCDFDALMDGEVALLIDRWAHLAAPASSRSRRSSAKGRLF